SSEELEDALVESLRSANAQLRSMTSSDGSLEGMGTTITAMLSSGSHFGVLHVGDSRAYRLRDNLLEQITHDHTLVQDLVDQGRITPEQANTHPQRSLLMRALDGRDVEPDLWIQEVVVGDRYLLCTDGLSGVVSEDTIL
nr:protein phosphatase 2C domain-containing protein [Micromonospora sp. DSM 115978]